MLWKNNWHRLPADSGTQEQNNSHQEQNYTVLAVAVGAAVLLLLLLLIVAVVLVTYKTRRKAAAGKRTSFVLSTCCDAQYVRDQPHVLLDTCWASMWAVATIFTVTHIPATFIHRQSATQDTIRRLDWWYVSGYDFISFSFQTLKKQLSSLWVKRNTVTSHIYRPYVTSVRPETGCRRQRQTVRKHNGDTLQISEEGGSKRLCAAVPTLAFIKPNCPVVATSLLIFALKPHLKSRFRCNFSCESGRRRTSLSQLWMHSTQTGSHCNHHTSLHKSSHLCNRT